MAAPLGQMIVVAHINAGTIGKILTTGGELIVMARDQPRPVSPVVFPGTVAWLNQAQVPDPVRGAPYVVQRSSVMILDAPGARTIREAPYSAFSLAIDDAHLYWCEIDGETRRCELWSYAHHRTDPARRLAIMGEPTKGAASWYPKLTVNATHVVWANPDARAIFGVDKRTTNDDARPVVLARTKHPPAHVAVDDYGAFALTGDPDARAWHVEHTSLRGEKSTVVAKYQRQLWDRPASVLDARGLFFTTNDRVLFLARAREEAS
jgi:hypothetical protein